MRPALPSLQVDTRLAAEQRASQRLGEEAAGLRSQLHQAQQASDALERQNAELRKRVEALQVGIYFCQIFQIVGGLEHPTAAASGGAGAGAGGVTGVWG